MTETDKARRYGQALGDLYARLAGDYESNYDRWEAAHDRKVQRQAQARKDYGLEPAPFIAEGCEGEPKPRE